MLQTAERDLAWQAGWSSGPVPRLGGRPVQLAACGGRNQKGKMSAPATRARSRPG